MSTNTLNVIGTIIAIILFIGSGAGISYKGLKDWKKYDSSADTKAKWGKFEFFGGIVLIILAFICVIVLINLVADGKIVDGDGDNSEPTISTMTTAPPTTIEQSTSETSDIYVETMLYQGATYTGYINGFRRPNGEGIMKYTNGQEYTGNWVDGVQQGQGMMKYNNGIYYGEWQNGARNGKGTYTWNDGKKYEGQYVDGVRNGYGIFSGWIDLTNGYSGTYYGESENDRFNGSGYFIFDNGDMFEGIYKEDLYWTGVYTKSDGSSYKVVNGKPK